MLPRPSTNSAAPWMRGPVGVKRKRGEDEEEGKRAEERKREEGERDESWWEEAWWEEEEEEDLAFASGLLLAVARFESLDLARSKLRGGCERGQDRTEATSASRISYT